MTLEVEMVYFLTDPVWHVILFLQASQNIFMLDFNKIRLLLYYTVSKENHIVTSSFINLLWLKWLSRSSNANLPETRPPINRLKLMDTNLSDLDAVIGTFQVKYVVKMPSIIYHQELTNRPNRELTYQCNS